MASIYKFAAYPSAKVTDKVGNQIQHLLWGDWVKIEGDLEGDTYPVRSRGVSGFMHKDDLQDEKLLDIIFVDVGQGDGCLVVTPDDKKIVIDAGQSDNMYRYLKWRFNFLGGPRKLDAAVITHPDKDHYYGFRKLFNSARVTFKNIYHNGIMEQNGATIFGPSEKIKKQKYISNLIETRDDLETFLSKPENFGRKKYASILKDGLSSATQESNNIKMLYCEGDAKNPKYLEGYEAKEDCNIQILNPIVEKNSKNKNVLRWFRTKPVGGSYHRGTTKNGHSVVLKLVYKNISILLGGDLNASSEAFLLSKYTKMDWPPKNDKEESKMVNSARKVLQSDIAKCCHHGSSDFTETFLKSVNTAATVISSGDEETHAHPRSDTLGAIGFHGRGWRPLIMSTELARSTREHEGDKQVQLGKILSKIDAEKDAKKKKKLVKERDDMIEELAKRNVTVYGAITLRSDGNKVIMAYKRERERIGKSGGKRMLSKWDIYKMESQDNEPLSYVK